MDDIAVTSRISLILATMVDKNTEYGIHLNTGIRRVILLSAKPESLIKGKRYIFFISMYPGSKVHSGLFTLPTPVLADNAMVEFASRISRSVLFKESGFVPMPIRVLDGGDNSRVMMITSGNIRRLKLIDGMFRLINV